MSAIRGHHNYRKSIVFIMVCALIGLGAISCGSGGGSSDTETVSGGGGSGDSSGFEVNGTISNLEIVASTSVGKASGNSGTVSHIVAVSPTIGGISCKTGSVDSTAGTFSLRLTARMPWFLYFIDQKKKGKRMFLGRLRSSTLDTFAPTSATGSLKFGTVNIDGASGTASATATHSEIISGLGVDADTADSIGTKDDMARRYGNPDADDDGEIDCNDSSKKYMLDFHVRFDMMVGGQRVAVNDIIDTYFADAVLATYTSTGIYVAYPTSFSSENTGSVTFVDSTVTTSEGGAIAKNTATSAVTTNNFSGYYGFGPNTTSTSELPSGDIVFTTGGKTLTFTDVATPSLAELTVPTGRIFPFIKFVKSSASCSSACTLASVDYKWMKKTATGWTAASLSEIDLLVAGNGGNLGFRVGLDSSSDKTIQWTIPKSAVSGSITWSAAHATLSGVSEAELTSLTTTQVCHVGLSYDDQLGMRYFEGIVNASGTCE